MKFRLTFGRRWVDFLKEDKSGFAVKDKYGNMEKWKN